MKQINIEKLKVLKERIQKIQTQNIQFYIPQIGRNIIRFIKHPEADLPFVPIGYHYLTNVSVLCPLIVENRPCPLCEMADRLSISMDLTDQGLASHFEVSEKGAYWIIDRSISPTTPYLFLASSKVHLTLINYLIENIYGDFTHPYNGRDFILEKSKHGMYFVYTLTAFPNTSPLAKDEKELNEIFNKINVDFRNIFICQPNDVLKQIAEQELALKRQEINKTSDIVQLQEGSSDDFLKQVKNLGDELRRK